MREVWEFPWLRRGMWFGVVAGGIGYLVSMGIVAGLFSPGRGQEIPGWVVPMGLVASMTAILLFLGLCVLWDKEGKVA